MWNLAQALQAKIAANLRMAPYSPQSIMNFRSDKLTQLLSLFVHAMHATSDPWPLAWMQKFSRDWIDALACMLTAAILSKHLINLIIVDCCRTNEQLESLYTFQRSWRNPSSKLQLKSGWKLLRSITVQRVTAVAVLQSYIFQWYEGKIIFAFSCSHNHSLYIKRSSNVRGQL